MITKTQLILMRLILIVKRNSSSLRKWSWKTKGNQLINKIFINIYAPNPTRYEINRSLLKAGPKSINSTNIEKSEMKYYFRIFPIHQTNS